MDFTEITVFTNSENAEVVAYFLQEVCLDGVTILDKNDLYQNASWTTRTTLPTWCTPTKLWSKVTAT